MRALTTIGDNRVEVREHADPIPGPGDVVIAVVGAGLNRADLLQRAGLYPAPPGSPPDIPGLEFCGTVVATGDSVDASVIGTTVFGICGGGGQAELLVVPAEHCVAVPDGLDPLLMGGVPEAFVTAHDAMVTQCRVQPDEWVLVHAAGSGVGTAAIQLAKALGAKVIGTARQADKLDRAAKLGLDVGIVAPQTDGRLDVVALASHIREATGGGVDVALDLVGGDYVTVDIQAAAPNARISLIGTLAGGQAGLPILPTMQKRLQLTGTVLRPRSRAEKAAATAAFARDVVPHLASGAIVPALDAVVPLDDATAAYDRMASDSTFGKLILDAGPSAT